MHIMFVNMYTNITVYLFVKNKAKETLKCIFSGKKKSNSFFVWKLIRNQVLSRLCTSSIVNNMGVIFFLFINSLLISLYINMN